MAKRTTIKNPAGSFYAKREKSGQFKELDEKGRSLAADRRTKAKTTVKPGYGDEGDQKKAATGRRAASKKKAPAKKK